MRIDGMKAFFTPEEEEKTEFENPLDLNEIDLHSLREAEVNEIARIEREALWSNGDGELPLNSVFRYLGPAYERAVTRKLALSKIASELATRTGLERIFDNPDDPLE